MELLQADSVAMELLAYGNRACTYHLGQFVIKVPHIWAREMKITQSNAEAAKSEANVYQILGTHDRIANCLYRSPTKDFIVLEYYGHGDLKKLDQWLLDSEMNARLSDFNVSGCDECPALGLPRQRCNGLEDPSWFMPRDFSDDSTVRSDLFALGSALYELEHGSRPHDDVGADHRDKTVTQRFARREYPSVSQLTLGRMILASWEGQFDSAADMLEMGAQIWADDARTGKGITHPSDTTTSAASPE